MTAVLLNGLLAVPLAFVALTVLVGRRHQRAAVRTAALGGLVTLGWSVWLAVDSAARLDGTQVDVAWLAALDIRWHLGVDGISLPLLLMSTGVFACVLIALMRGSRRARVSDCTA